MEKIIHEIIDRVLRAHRLDTSLFLIVYYETEGDKREFLEKFNKKVSAKGLNARVFDPVRQPEHGAGKLLPQLAAAAGAKELCLLQDIPRNMESFRLDDVFLGYLNLQRDNIFNVPIRLILFLQKGDAEQFMEVAGDLWDFRHHTYWVEGKIVPQGTELWQNLEHLTAKMPLPKVDRLDVKKHLRVIRLLVNKTTDLRDKAGLMLDLTEWLLRRNAASSAVEAAREGLAYITSDDSELRARLESQLGDALIDELKPEEALEHYQESIAIYRKIGYRQKEANILADIATIHKMNRNFKESRKSYEESLGILEDINDKYGQAEIYHNLGIVTLEEGDYQRAEKNYFKALSIRQELEDYHSQANTYHQLGILAQGKRDYVLARKYYLESLNIYQEFKDRYNQASTYHQLGILAQLERDYNEAKRYYKEALKIKQQFNTKYSQVSTYNQLGMLAEKENNFIEAKDNYMEALIICQEFHDRHIQAVIYRHLGIVAEKERNFIDAKKNYKEALNICRELNDVHCQASTYNCFGMLARKEKDYAASLWYYANAIQIFSEHKKDYSLQITIKNLSRLMNEWDASEAIEKLDVYKETKKTLRQILKDRKK
ncbi:MAG: tetratricopeptide repeat protein [bacterium]|nr:tetratricopeptide repeat protein [bacterium]